MKISILKILVICFIALGVVTFIDFYKEGSEKEATLKKSQIIPFAIDQISEIVIEKESEKIYMQRSPDGWQMLSPVKDWCDNQIVDEMINSLSQEKYKSIASDKIDLNLGAFGLEQPKAKMIFKNNQGKAFAVNISNKQNFEGDQFLQINEEKKVLVANSIWGNHAGKNSTSFRDRRLIRHKIASLQELVFQNSAKTEIIQSVNGQWVDPEHKDWILDQNKIREYIRILGDTQGSEFMWQGPLADDSLKNKYGFSKSAFHLHLKLNEIDWRADFSKDKDQWAYAFTNLPQQVLKLEPGSFEKIQNFNVNSFRDLTIPFRLKVKNISQFNYQNKVKKLNLQLSEGVWKSIDDSQLKMDQEKIKVFFDKFKNTKALRFTALKNPMTASLKLYNEDRELIFELKWSNEFKITEGPVEKDVVFAQSSLVKDLFLIEKSEMAEWGLADIFK